MRFLPGVLFGAVLGAAAMGIYTGIGLAAAIGIVAGQYATIALLAGATLFALFILYVFRNAIARLVFGTATRELEDLVQDASDCIDDLAERRYDEVKERLTDAAKSIVASLTLWAARAALARVMIALFIASAGAFGTYVLIQQNELIARQTDTLDRQRELASTQVELITAQNRLLDDQTRIALIASHLQNAQGRTIYTNEVDEIVAQISAESRALEEYDAFLGLSGDVNHLEEQELNYYRDTGRVRLSSDLVDRIYALLPRLEPYIVVEFSDLSSQAFTDLDSVVVRYTSPERGLILRALISNNVDIAGHFESDIINPVNNANFTFADLRNYQDALPPRLTIDNCEYRGPNAEFPYPTYWEYVALMDGREYWPGGQSLGPDLRTLNLSGADFSGSTFYGININADFSETDISNWSSVSFYSSDVRINDFNGPVVEIPNMRLINTRLDIEQEYESSFDRFEILYDNLCSDELSIYSAYGVDQSQNITQNILFTGLDFDETQLSDMDSSLQMIDSLIAGEPIFGEDGWEVTVVNDSQYDVETDEPWGKIVRVVRH